MALTGTLIEATRIQMVRAEGPSDECGEVEIKGGNVWKTANAILKTWAETAPEEGEGYDKCDIFIEFADDANLSFRFDLQRQDMNDVDLGETALNRCLYHGDLTLLREEVQSQWIEFPLKYRLIG